MKHQSHTGSALSLERMLFFSDAVFAIAITLLVIELKVPDLPHHSSRLAYAQALLDLAPKFLAFILSFLVIGRFWISHHDTFTRSTGYDRALLWPNLHLLMAIAFMPFTSGFVGAGDNTFVPALLYNCNLLVVGLLHFRLVRRLEKLGLAAPATGVSRAGGEAVIVAALISVALTFTDTQFSQIGMATVPLWQRLFARKAGK